METNRRVHEVKYIRGDVQVCIAGPCKEEALFNGKLYIMHEVYGSVVEWRATGECVSQEKRRSPDSENLDWEDVAPPLVSYRVDNKDAIEIKPSNRLPNDISFELTELKSYRRIDFPNKAKIGVQFYLRDGTSIPTFYFEPEQFYTFLEALEKFAVIKQSVKDPELYLAFDAKEDALTKSFSELELFDENKSHIVTKFFQAPYSTAMGGFSKVTNFLLDYLVYSNDSASPPRCTEEEVAEMLGEGLPQIDICQQEDHGFEVITCLELPPRPEIKRYPPVDVSDWESHISKDGTFHDVPDLKSSIFCGGLVDALRPEAWKYLLGYYSFSSTTKERDLVRRKRVDDYYRMKLQWRSMSSDQESRFAALRDRKSLIEKDVCRTDRLHPYFEGDNNNNLLALYDILMTYCMYNFDLGYVQGMSDLVTPFLVVMQNEAEAFWCFALWLEKIGSNFEMDQQGMKTQLMNLHRLIHFVDAKFCNYLENHESGNLYFCFRWLLILFKRDFRFEEVLRLWEVLWTDLPCKNFHLLICIAILDTEKSTIMENNFGLTEILKHINDMSYRIDLEETLCKAEAIYHQIKTSVYMSDVVQDILGICVPDDEDGPLATNRGLGSTQEGRVLYATSYSPFSREASSHQRNHSSPSDASSVENIDEYEDLGMVHHHLSVDRYNL